VSPRTAATIAESAAKSLHRNANSLQRPLLSLSACWGVQQCPEVRLVPQHSEPDGQQSSPHSSPRHWQSPPRHSFSGGQHTRGPHRSCPGVGNGVETGSVETGSGLFCRNGVGSKRGRDSFVETGSGLFWKRGRRFGNGVGLETGSGLFWAKRGRRKRGRDSFGARFVGAAAVTVDRSAVPLRVLTYQRYSGPPKMREGNHEDASDSLHHRSWRGDARSRISRPARRMWDDHQHTGDAPGHGEPPDPAETASRSRPASSRKKRKTGKTEKRGQDSLT
jgi:hypothetical protein